MTVAIYRLMEIVDGEKGPKLLSYRVAQKIKMWCLYNMKGE
jgi:hypothetical protein